MSSLGVQSNRNPEIQYVLASPSDIEDMALFIKESFFTREPLSQKSELVVGPREWEWIRVFVRNIVEWGLSLKAVDTGRNNELVGVKLARVVSVPKVPVAEEYELLDRTSTAFRAVLGLVGQLEQVFMSTDIGPVRSYLMNELTGVKEGYGGKGLCTEMLKLTEKNARENYDVQLSIVAATNPHAQRSYLNSGYKVGSELPYAAFTVGESCPFKGTDEENKTAKLLYKYFD